jgi:hypothetical protein
MTSRIKLTLIAILLLAALSASLVHLGKRNNTLAPGVTVDAYLKTASERIMTMLEFHGVKEIPPRNNDGVTIIDNCLTSSLPPENAKTIELDPNQLTPPLWFPNGFFLTEYTAKSGFLKSDPRKYSFEYVALWKLKDDNRWKKSSIIFTRDRDIIKKSDEIVDDSWINENLQEFPAPNSKTRLMIENLQGGSRDKK